MQRMDGVKQEMKRPGVTALDRSVFYHLRFNIYIGEQVHKVDNYMLQAGI